MFPFSQVNLTGDVEADISALPSFCSFGIQQLVSRISRMVGGILVGIIPRLLYSDDVGL
jgi:hypothetical protein